MASNRIDDVLRLAERIHAGETLADYALSLLRKIAACASQSDLDRVLALEIHALSASLPHRGRG